MAILQIRKDNFEESVSKAEKPVLLDFWASWCAPCRMVSPLIEEIAAQRTDITVGKINVDEEPELAQMFQITAIPTLMVVENGTATQTAVGVMSKDEILALLDT